MRQHEGHVTQRLHTDSSIAEIMLLEGICEIVAIATVLTRKNHWADSPPELPHPVFGGFRRGEAMKVGDCRFRKNPACRQTR